MRADTAQDAVAGGSLSAAGRLVTRVPIHGSYLVCVSPPDGWRAADAAAVVLPGWICRRVRTGTSPETVSIPVAKQVPAADGSRP